MEPFERYSVQGSCSEKVSGQDAVVPTEEINVKLAECPFLTENDVYMYNDYLDQVETSHARVSQPIPDKVVTERSNVEMSEPSQAVKNEIDYGQFHSFLLQAGDIAFSEEEVRKDNTQGNKNLGRYSSSGSATNCPEQGSTFSSVQSFSGTSRTNNSLNPNMPSDALDVLHVADDLQMDDPIRNHADKDTITTYTFPLSKIPQRSDCAFCCIEFDQCCPRHNCHSCRQRVGAFNALLCKSCRNAYHVACMIPTLYNLYQSQWVCHVCQPNRPVIPNGSLVYTGKVPGILVGASWKYRIQLCENNLHKPNVAGIHGSGYYPAFSIVLQGDYALDEDNGLDFFYTGSGGRVPKGETHIMNQELTKNNLSLACSCDADLNYEGATARDWTKSSPIRVIRGANLKRHRLQYAPENFRYDGIYKLVRYWKERIPEGFIVWRFHFRRDDDEPAPWTPEGKQYILDNNIRFEDHDPIKRAPRASKLPGALSRHLLTSLIVSSNAHPPIITRTISKPKFRTSSLPLRVFEQAAVDLPKAKSVDVHVDMDRAMQITEDSEMKMSSEMQVAEDSEMQVSGDVPEAIYISDTEEAPETTIPYVSIRDILFAATNPFILNDKRNRELWREILADKAQSFNQFLAKVRVAFECNLCFDLVEYTFPCTTVCGHNFCRACFRDAVHINQNLCPTCKKHLPDDCMEEGKDISEQEITNIELGYILLILNPAFDADP